jgi:hypothetical protein
MHVPPRNGTSAYFVDKASICDCEQPGKHRPRLRFGIPERSGCIDEYPLCQLLRVVMVTSPSEKEPVDGASMLEISLLHRIFGGWVRHSTHSKLVSTVSPTPWPVDLSRTVCWCD